MTWAERLKTERLTPELYGEMVGHPEWGEGMRRLIPGHMHEGLCRWLIYGHRAMPGHFLSAVISGDLFEAVRRADDENGNRLRDYVVFFYNYAPVGSRGGDVLHAYSGLLPEDEARSQSCSEGDPR